MKLSIELVPSTCWYSNLRNVVAKEDWDKIRNRSYKEADCKCSVCGLRLTLYCHEVWQYDDEKLVQTLVGFVALCNLCHMVKHIGYAGILANEGKLNYRDLISHFLRVNECCYDDFMKYRAEAFEIWEVRSMYEWKCELGEYYKIVDY